MVRSLFAYQTQEDRRLWNEAIMTLPASAFTIDTGYSWGSLQAECVHVIDVMQHSLQRVQSLKSISAAVTIANPTRAQIRQIWDAVETQWRAYFSALDDQTFQREIDIVYRDTAMTTPVWQTIFHFFNHNTLHRAEMRQMVTALGGAANADSPFINYCLAGAR
jgi:uncharacterized damage-inducible protein DinB